MNTYLGLKIGTSFIAKGEVKYDKLIKAKAKEIGVANLNKTQRIETIKNYNFKVSTQNKLKLERSLERKIGERNEEVISATKIVLGFGNTTINGSKFGKLNKSIKELETNFDKFIEKNNKILEKQEKAYFKGKGPRPNLIRLAKGTKLNEYAKMNNSDDYGDSLSGEYGKANGPLLTFAKMVNVWIKNGRINKDNVQSFLKEFNRLLTTSPVENNPKWVENAYLELQAIAESGDFSKTPKESWEERKNKAQAEAIRRLKDKGMEYWRNR